MSEILFRGKQNEGRWVEGVYFKHDTVKVCFSSDDPKPRHLIIQDGFCDWGFEPPIHCVDVDPETVGQFTGLHDNNGKGMFEGDIVEYKGECGKIEYSENEAMFTVSFDTWRTGFDHLRVKDIEVIGNIHDNPELLEVGEDG